MEQGMYTAASGAIALEERLEVISNNLANVNTTGFKKDALVFEEFSRILDTASLAPGQYRTTPVDVRVGGYFVDTTPGPVRMTRNPLDVAVMGDGFFVVNTDDGPRYTRSGSFQLSPEGVLVTVHGDAIQGEGGDIFIEDGELVIDSSGSISINGAVTDTLQVVKIPAEALLREGNGLFSIREGYSPEVLDAPWVAQGSIEASNVDPIREMITMITVQHAYESIQKVIKTIQDSYSHSIQKVGTIA
ncbi:MAG TPA: flagellar basal-body rod protein FlgF [Deltaproteobacteria bacterium]|nr:flagellar basal-body rod protein FlgF [Desulfomonilia bacterium]HDP25062.1 flagellar basal-body rod protein FlgF [Deltaproteobacteria bacterium]